MDMRHHSNGYWRLAAAAFISFGAVQLCSCGGGPSPVRPPSISASAAGEEAIELCDASGDGTATADELDKAPSLKSALKRLDTNGDGAVSPDEVADRIDKWQEIGIEARIDRRPGSGQGCGTRGTGCAVLLAGQRHDREAAR